MSLLTPSRILPTALVCVILAAFVPTAVAATSTPVFHPRVGHALGLIPPINSQGPIKTLPGEEGQATPLIYRAGTVMTGGVTVHTIFWAPSGFKFQGSPGTGIPGYQELVERFYIDVAASSGVESKCDNATDACNVFTNLTQYGQGTLGGPLTPGDYNIKYEPLTDSVTDTETYPAPAKCFSPANAKACITDEQVQKEVTRIIEERHEKAGLNNLWFVFLPPNVDECAEPGACGTNAFLGYHSLEHRGKEATVYAVAIDPTIEVGFIPGGGDPQENPAGEIAVEVAAHETDEAMTDPEGTGWGDPNGFEVGDKCDRGPQTGTPLGFASDGSPYNQVINGHQYFFQEMWSNADHGCVQGVSESVVPLLPLSQVNLTQFSHEVSGQINTKKAGVTVEVSILRQTASGSPIPVASQSTTTEANGFWKVTLAHAVGDDRDQIDVEYSGIEAPTPNKQVILTGNGGLIQEGSGWTGWTDLDKGVALSEEEMLLAPCFQAGVLSYAVNEVAGTVKPNEFCGGGNIAEFKFPAKVTRGSEVTVSSNDNRAFAPSNVQEPNPAGGLVKLTVPVGEPDSFSLFPSVVPEFFPTGFPICFTELGAQAVTCLGLTVGEIYTLTDGAQKASREADEIGAFTVALTVKGGDAIALSNASHRVLTTLHVANLKVHIVGNSGPIEGGTCSPDEYWGGPIVGPFASLEAGEPSSVAGGAALTGVICPPSGNPAGLPTEEIGQTDELSGGATFTGIPTLANTSPMEAETMYGSFVALAETGEGEPPVALSIKKAEGGPVVFSAANVDTSGGVQVSGLEPSTYKATWTVINANGDTRTVTTRFIEQPALQGAPGSAGTAGTQGATGAQGPTGPQGPAGPKPKVSCKLTGKKHNKIQCTVTFPRATHGLVRLSISRGAHIAALGHGQLSHGAMRVTMRELGRPKAGAWTLTLVLSSAHKHAQTRTLNLRMR